MTFLWSERKFQLTTIKLLISHHGTITITLMKSIVIQIWRETSRTDLANGELIHHRTVMVIGHRLRFCTDYGRCQH